MQKPQNGTVENLSADRLKAFTDGVLAIALTLLILPLMDGVGDAAASHDDVGQWITGEWPQLFSFLLSFVLIASFWKRHHRLFAGVEYTTDRLLWLTFAWMLTIVWLPVATAVVGQFSSSPLQILIYVGTMLVGNVLLLVTRLYVMRHPELTPTGSVRDGLASDVAPTILFIVALALALALPSVGYWAVLVLVLSRPLTAILKRARQPTA